MEQLLASNIWWKQLDIKVQEYLIDKYFGLTSKTEERINFIFHSECKSIIPNYIENGLRIRITELYNHIKFQKTFRSEYFR